MNYTLTDNLELKLNYLRELYMEENERQTIIEGKQSQVLGQCGVILSLVGLFIPMYLDKLSKIDLGFQLTLIGVFLMTVILYFLAILKSSKFLNTSNYIRPHAATVKDIFNSADHFRQHEIDDLLTALAGNQQINNNKVKDLKSAYGLFRWANGATIFLSLLLLSTVFFPSKEVNPELKVSLPVQIENNITGKTNEVLLTIKKDTLKLIKK